MRKTLGIAILFVVLAVAAVLAHHGPMKVTIDAAADKQPGVVFDHHAHSTKLVKSCDTCHHTEKGLTAESDKRAKKCSSCHLDPKADVPSMRAASMKTNPFHTVCVDCHKEQKKGPVVCKNCHVKS